MSLRCQPREGGDLDEESLILIFKFLLITSLPFFFLPIMTRWNGFLHQSDAVEKRGSVRSEGPVVGSRSSSRKKKALSAERNWSFGCWRQKRRIPPCQTSRVQPEDSFLRLRPVLPKHGVEPKRCVDYLARSAHHEIRIRSASALSDIKAISI